MTRTAEQFAAGFAAQVRDIFRRSGRSRPLKFGTTADGFRVTVTARYVAEPDGVSDLPPVLRTARPAWQRTFRALKAIRAGEGTGPTVMPADIADWIKAAKEPALSIDTINHALDELRKLKLVWRHPDSRWQVGEEQKILPFSGEQEIPPTPPDPVAYSSGTDDAGVGRSASGRLSMAKQLIWVPGEKNDYGIVIEDAVTEEPVLATDRHGEMQVPDRNGRLSKRDAARVELVRVDGRYAVVKVGGKEVRVKNLGEWQLKGLTAPEHANAV